MLNTKFASPVKSTSLSLYSPTKSFVATPSSSSDRIRQSCFQAKNSYRSLSNSRSPYCRTPFRQSHEVEAFTTIKPSFEKRTLAFQSPRRGFTSTQPKFRRPSVDSNLSKNSHCDSLEEILPQRKRVKISLKNLKNELHSISPHFPKTPAFKEISQSQQRSSSSSPRRRPLKRKSTFFASQSSSSSEYLPAKRLRSDELPCHDLIQLSNSLNNKRYEFAVFKDYDLGNSKSIQESIQHCEIDNDCQTESEQISRAIEQGEKELRETIYLLNLRKKNDSRGMSDPRKPLSSGSKTDRLSSGSASVNLDSIEAIVPMPIARDEGPATPCIVKRLSFGKTGSG